MEVRHLIIDNDREVNLNNIKDGKREKEEIKEEIGGIREEYLRLIVTDPFLPKELLPINWAFAELTSTLRKFATG